MGAIGPGRGASCGIERERESDRASERERERVSRRSLSLQRSDREENGENEVRRKKHFTSSVFFQSTRFRLPFLPLDPGAFDAATLTTELVLSCLLALVRAWKEKGEGEERES